MVNQTLRRALILGPAALNTCGKRTSLEIKSMVSLIFRTCIVAFATVCASTACTYLRVTSDVNPGLGTSHCHTYAWAGVFHAKDGIALTVANPLNETRLRGAIAANLQSKGVQPATAEADCLVGYGIGVQTVVEGGYPYGWGWAGGRGFYGGWGWDYPYVYREGIVAVDLYDARSRQPLWHASVDQNFVGLTGEAADNKIKAAVAAIFTKYPS
jgi:Domain of unknown function (DUF4136)